MTSCLSWRSIYTLFLAFSYEDPNLSSHLHTVLALMKRNLLSVILEEFTNISSTFSSANKIALAVRSYCRYPPTTFARPYPVISRIKS